MAGLENPQINLQDWLNLNTRLASIEAVLGMTNSSVLNDAAGDLATGIFAFNGTTVGTAQAKILVKSAVVKMQAGQLFTGQPFKFNDTIDDTWAVFPIASAVRVINFTGTAAPKNHVRSMIEGGPNAEFYRPSQNITVRVYSQDTLNADNAGVDAKSSMDVCVTLLAVCAQGTSIGV
jgi:hypothetical protein